MSLETAGQVAVGGLAESRRLQARHAFVEDHVDWILIDPSLAPLPRPGER
jgi:hypothetical protein